MPNPHFGNNFLDLTTRQDVQMHWLKMGNVPEIWRRLEEVGITTVQACGDSARNVLCCPVSGLGHDEVIDAYPVAQAISAYFTGNREYANLPRKFKMSVTGCLEDCAQAEINDVGMLPARLEDGTLGFNLRVGGGLSDGPRMASDIDVFVRPEEAVEITRGIAQVFGELGNRENRWTARMRYLVQELGPEGFREELEKRVSVELTPAGEDLTKRYRGDHVGVHPQNGRRGGFEPPVRNRPLLRRPERARGQDERGAVRGGGQARRGVRGRGPPRHGPEPHHHRRPRGPAGRPARRAASGSGTRPNPGAFERGVVACTGSEFCRFGIVETKVRAVEWAREMDERVGDLGQEAVRMHFSGCSASCAQPQIGDIGFRGETAKTRDAIVEGVDIGLGGSLGRDAAFIDWVEGAKPADEVPDALVAVFERFEEERREGERFHEWARRKKNAELREALERKPATRAGSVRVMAGFDIRDMMNDIDEAPGKVWFWDLEKAVIDADRCVQCGVCVAACPTDSIGIGEDDLPELVKMCTGCSLCWDFCPRGGLQYESTWKITGGSEPARSIEGIGRVEESYTARVRQRIDGVQDGGFVSALLISLLEAGEIDGALAGARERDGALEGRGFPGDDAGGGPRVRGQLLQPDARARARRLRGLRPAAEPAASRSSGRRARSRASRRCRRRPWTWGSSKVEAITLTIALLCTKSFNYEKLMLEEIRDKRNVDLDDVGRVDIIRGKMIVQDLEGETIFEEPIRDFHGAALKGCDECADFMGHAADISVGSVGSADGYSSVLVRSEEGLAAFDSVRERLELRPLDKPQALDKLDGLDKRVAFNSLKRAFDPDAPLFIDYEEHLNDYAGTDRAPVEHEAVRY